MTHYLTFPDRETWEAFGWVPSECGMYAYGPNGEFADVIGENYYFQHEDGTREPRPGLLVNIAGSLPAELEQYATETPQHPKRVFL